jgi:type I site-specific restriction-modification system R (restriction) subunit
VEEKTTDEKIDDLHEKINDNHQKMLDFNKELTKKLDEIQENLLHAIKRDSEEKEDVGGKVVVSNAQQLSMPRDRRIILRNRLSQNKVDALKGAEVVEENKVEEEPEAVSIPPPLSQPPLKHQ